MILRAEGGRRLATIRQARHAILVDKLFAFSEIIKYIRTLAASVSLPLRNRIYENYLTFQFDYLFIFFFAGTERDAGSQRNQIRRSV